MKVVGIALDIEADIELPAGRAALGPSARDGAPYRLHAGRTDCAYIVMELAHRGPIALLVRLLLERPADGRLFE